jgi:aspartate racemase
MSGGQRLKTIGLLGGMSWESTAHYYRHMNELVRQRLGGLHSARLLLYSVDFHDIERLQHEGRWEEAGRYLAGVAQSLEQAGAEALVLCTNSMHKVAPVIDAGLTIPLLHIADATADAVRAQGLNKVGLLGTRFTMEQEFYRAWLERHGLEVLVPGASDRQEIDRVIFEELCRGVIRPQSRAAYRDIIAGLAARGAQGVILGCTEIALLVAAADAEVPLFDTTAIHAASAIDFALS